MGENVEYIFTFSIFNVNRDRHHNHGDLSKLNYLVYLMDIFSLKKQKTRNEKIMDSNDKYSFIAINKKFETIDGKTNNDNLLKW